MTGRLNRVLNLAMTALTPALEDVKMGTASTHAFRALFKYDGAKEYVGDMLKQVSNFEPKLGLLPNPSILLRPRIACAQPGIRERYRWLPLGTDLGAIAQSARSLLSLPSAPRISLYAHDFSCCLKSRPI